ncbi:MAG TPA: cobalamin-binding protein [Candidatus Obscuribacterales bacterium]
MTESLKSLPRIVSLLPSATEIVCGLGFQDQLVGRSHECDFPAGVQALPVLTAPKFEPDGTSYAIDQRVRAIVQEGLAVYRVDATLLRQLGPDVIVTQSQCEVCAVNQADVEAAVCELTGHPLEIVSLKPDDLAHVWQDIQNVAQALGAPERGQALLADLQGRMQTISERAQKAPVRPRVACIEWIEPLMAAGNWMPELIELAGGINLFGTAGQHSPWMKWPDLRAADPDVLLIMPCGFDIARIRQETDLLQALPGWSGLKAVMSGQVYVTDGNQYFNRPGPRLVDSLEILAEILHPGLFEFGHQNTGWEVL